MTRIEYLAKKVRIKHDLEKVKCEKSYYHFFKRAWRVLENDTPLDKNWHQKYLCDLLQKEMERIAARQPKDKDLIINISPRSGKSYICTIMLAPWVWSKWPHIKFLNNSHNKELSTKHCLDSRRLIESEWYQSHWGHMFELTSDMNTKSWYQNDKGGMRKSTSTGAGVYGAGADVITNDDPQDPEKGQSEVERETVIRHHGKTLYSRINDQRIGLRIVIQQRLHEEDLTGYLLKTNPEKYIHICIPAEETDHVFPKELKSYYKLGLFFPLRFSREILADAKLESNLGEYGFAGQMLQEPAPPEGGMFKKTWWWFWKHPGQTFAPVRFTDAEGNLVESKVINLPQRFDSVIDSWDPGLKGELTSDDVVGSKWGKLKTGKFLLDRIKGKLTFGQTKAKIRSLRSSRADTSTVIIENSANGPALQDDLKEEIPGIILVKTGKLSKEERARVSDNTPYAAQVQAGNVIIPHPQIAPWVNDWIKEHADFPRTKQDGQVDSGGQAVNYLTTRKRVWPYYQPLDPVQRSDFKVNWIGSPINYCSIYMDSAMKYHVMGAAWDKFEQRLFVYGELYGSTLPMPDMATLLVKNLRLRSRTCSGVICNDEMFKDQRKSPAKVLSSELSQLQAGVSVRPSRRYDKAGSIALVNTLFSQGKICVHEVCEKSNLQFAGWHVEKEIPVKLGFELCENLCLIISELNKSVKLLASSAKLPDYTEKIDGTGNPVLAGEVPNEKAGWDAK